MKIQQREIIGKSKLYVARTENTHPQMMTTPHRHSFYEIAWLERGSGQFICDFESYDLEQGTLIFVAPGRVHSWQPQENFNLIPIGFKASLLAENWINPALVSALPYFTPSAQPYMSVPQARLSIFNYLFSTVYNRYDELGVQVENYIELSEENENIILAYLHLILVEAERLYAEIPTENHQRTAIKELSVSFQTTVEATYTKRWKIQDYADHLGVTPNYLAEVIRETSGKTPSEVVQERILVEAQRLLAFTEDTIAQIADYLSFVTPSQFGQWFKKRTNTTPGKFRQQFQKP